MGLLNFRCDVTMGEGAWEEVDLLDWTCSNRQDDDSALIPCQSPVLMIGHGWDKVKSGRKGSVFAQFF